jgi:TonB family protein
MGVRQQKKYERVGRLPVQIVIKLATLTGLFLFAALLMAQAPGGDGHKAAPQVCKLISANPPDFNPFQFVPKVVDSKRLNRFPKVAYVVNEDGSVSNVKILKGTGSPKVDADLVRSVLTWKYKPQLGCTFEMSMGVIIDIGSR